MKPVRRFFPRHSLARRFRALLDVPNLLALFVLGLAALLLWRLRQAGLDLGDPQILKAYVLSLGMWGPLGYTGLLAVTVVVSQLPGVPLAVAAGMLWGPLLGGAYTVAGGFLGSLVAYYLGRTLGRSAVRGLTSKVVTLSRTRGEPYLAAVVLVSRLLPVVPFDVVSYACGVVGLNVFLYAGATLVGMVPSVLMLTYLGDALLMSPLLALGLSALAALGLLLFPWLVVRHNWLDLRDVETLAKVRDG